MKSLALRISPLPLAVLLSAACMGSGGGQPQNGGPGGATSLSCGDGTFEEEGLCKSALRCGDGTREEDGVCNAEPRGPELSCGSGTEAQAGVCLPALSTICGTDTRPSSLGTTCVGRLACGSGTRRSGDACVPSQATLTCGSGTQRSGDTCVATAPTASMTCGNGTIAQNNVCQPDGATLCASGTRWSGSRCEVAPVAPATTVGQFPSLSGLNVAHYQPYYSSGPHPGRLVVTTLSQSMADAYAQAGAPMVGSGQAVLLNYNFSSRLGTYDEEIVPLRKTAPSSGSTCLSDSYVEPNMALLRYGTWSNATFTELPCVMGGSVKLKTGYTSPNYTITATFNVQFSDGTAWVDKSFTTRFVAP